MNFWAWFLKHRNRFGKLLGFSTVLSLVLFIFILTIVGATYGNDTRIYKLQIECVDLDDGFVGQALLQLCNQIPGSASEPTLVISNYSSFQAAQNSLLEASSWGMLVVNANATSNLLAAIEAKASGQNTTYDPTTAITFVMDPGRNPSTVSANIAPFATGVMFEFQTIFAEQFWKTQFANRPMTPSQLVSLTSLIVTPISHTVLPLSVVQPVGVAVSTMMILLVGTAFAFLQVSLIIMRPAGSELDSLVVRVLFMGLSATICTGIISLGWSAPVAIYSGAPGPTFLYFWLANWLLQLVILTALIIAMPLLGRKLVGLFFAIFLLANLAGGPANVTISSPFYSWAYITPVYHCFAISRYILFGGHNPLSISLSALLGMLGLNTLLLPCVMALNFFVLVPRGYGIAPLPLEEESTEEQEKETVKKTTKQEEMKQTKSSDPKVDVET